MLKRKQVSKSYYDVILGSTVPYCKRYAFQVIVPNKSFDTVLEKLYGMPELYVVPASFWASLILNYSRYLLGGKDSGVDAPFRRVLNIEFRKIGFPVHSIESLVKHTSIQCIASTVFNIGDDLFLDYVPDYFTFSDISEDPTNM